MKTGVECEYLPDRRRTASRISDAADTPGEALLRPAGADAPLRRHHRDLRLHAGARLEALPERPRGRERPVRDELGIRRLPDDRRPPRLLQVHGQGDRREARLARHLHAEALHQPHRQRLPRPCLGLGQERQEQPVPRSQGRARPVQAGLPVPRRRHPQRRCALLLLQPDGEQLQAHQRAAHDLGRHLGAQHHHLSAATTAPTWCASPTPAASSCG